MAACKGVESAHSSSYSIDQHLFNISLTALRCPSPQASENAVKISYFSTAGTKGLVSSSSRAESLKPQQFP